MDFILPASEHSLWTVRLRPCVNGAGHFPEISLCVSGRVMTFLSHALHETGRKKNIHRWRRGVIYTRVQRKCQTKETTRFWNFSWSGPNAKIIRHIQWMSTAPHPGVCRHGREVSETVRRTVGMNPADLQPSLCFFGSGAEHGLGQRDLHCPENSWHASGCGWHFYHVASTKPRKKLISMGYKEG